MIEDQPYDCNKREEGKENEKEKENENEKWKGDRGGGRETCF